MSKVRLIDIYNERFNEPSLKLSATADIEVVPRKMVEMIIEKCDVMKLQTIDDDYEKSFVRFNTCISLKEYAESLLKQFEEE